MKYTLPFVTQEMMENGHITVEVIEAKSTWFGVTYYEDKEVAVATLAELTNKGAYQLLMEITIVTFQLTSFDNHLENPPSKSYTFTNAFSSNFVALLELRPPR